jgi:hypothetical protein
MLANGIVLVRLKMICCTPGIEESAYRFCDNLTNNPDAQVHANVLSTLVKYVYDVIVFSNNSTVKKLL